MKLRLGTEVYPYAELKGTTICVSDWHYGHFEFERVGINGISPHTIIHRFCRGAINHSIFVVHLGDLIDSVARGPEAIKLFQQFHRGALRRAFPNWNVHGNHDNRWDRALELDFQNGDIWLPEDSLVMGAHGHQAHKWWTSKRTVRRWLHEQTYRMGYTIQDVIHPDADSWILDVGKWVGEKFIKPGRKLGRAKSLVWAIETVCQYAQRTVLVQGHTHFPCVFIMTRVKDVRVVKGDRMLTEWVSQDGRYSVKAKIPLSAPNSMLTVIDVGTALPHGEDHPEGLYKKGEVYPFGYVVEKQMLVRIEMEGFRIVEPYS